MCSRVIPTDKPGNSLTHTRNRQVPVCDSARSLHRGRGSERGTQGKKFASQCLYHRPRAPTSSVLSNQLVPLPVEALTSPSLLACTLQLGRLECQYHRPSICPLGRKRWATLPAAAHHITAPQLGPAARPGLHACAVANQTSHDRRASKSAVPLTRRRPSPARGLARSAACDCPTVPSGLILVATAAAGGP